MAALDISDFQIHDSSKSMNAFNAPSDELRLLKLVEYMSIVVYLSSGGRAPTPALCVWSYNRPLFQAFSRITALNLFNCYTAHFLKHTESSFGSFLQINHQFLTLPHVGY